MWIKNISGVSQRLLSVSGDVSVPSNGVVEIKSSRFNPRFFAEVDADGNLKSAKVLVTENDKRTVAVDMEPVVAPSGAIQEKIVDEAPAPVPAVEPVIDPTAAPTAALTAKKGTMNTTKSVLGRPKKLQ